MLKPILIVDANRFILDVLQNILQRKLGLPVQAMLDIQEGARVFAERDISFILLGADWQGPAMKQAVDYLRAARAGTQTPIIIMISDSEPNPQTVLTDCGANGYIFKPFTEGEIIQWIKTNSQSLLGYEWQDADAVNLAPGEAAPAGQRSDYEQRIIEDHLLNLSSIDFATKAKAVVELGRLRAPEAVDKLIELLYSDADDLKVYVITALGNIRDPKAVQELVALLNYKDRAVQEAVVEALAKIGDPRVVRPLSRILKVPDKKMVLLAIKALGMLGNREAVSVLESMLQVGDEEVRANAQWALRKIDGMDV